MKRLLLLLFVFCLSSSYALAAKQLFLLSAPIQKSVSISKPLLTPAVLLSASYATGTSVSTYYLSDENLWATIPVALYQYLGEIPAIAVQMRGILDAQAHAGKHGELQQIGDINGVGKIRLFNTSYAEYKGIFPTKLHSTSLVFVEAEADSLPDVLGNKWIRIEEPSKSVVKMQLNIRGDKIGKALEIPLEKFLNSEDLDVSKRQEWETAIKAWKKEQPLVDRLILQRNYVKDVSISGSIQVNGVNFELSSVATGKGTENIIKPSMITKLFSKLKYKAGLSNSPKHQLVTSVDVVEQAGPHTCPGIFERIFHRKIVRRPNANP